jgi:Flp pilus assembly protein TadG
MNNKNRKGQELVEFAMVASIVFIFLFGIIDWGIAFLNYETLAQRAAYAARYYSATENMAAANNILTSGTPAGGSGYNPMASGGGSAVISVSAPIADAGTFSGVPTYRRYVSVTITGYKYQMFTPFVGRLLSSGPIVTSHVMEP